MNSYRRKKKIETICFASVACFLITSIILAVLRGRGLAVGVILGLVGAFEYSYILNCLSAGTLLGKRKSTR